MVILAINAGSSSVKFQVLETDTRETLIDGRVEKIGAPDVFGKIKDNGESSALNFDGVDYAAAVQSIADEITSRLEARSCTLDAVGHRVVHGGAVFQSSVLIDAEVEAAIEQLSPLAPLHNPANLQAFRFFKTICPDIPHVAVFDTAFHQTMPEIAYRYAVPREWVDEYKVRRYGFHGTSHAYVSQKAIELFNLSPTESRLIVAHLGNGCSATAIEGGKSLDTTMGISPLEGLVMGTRSGSLDPNLVQYMCQQTGKSVEEITRTLNHDSGVKALVEGSPDMREVEDNYVAGDEKATLALNIFVYRLVKEILALVASFNGKPVDGLIFTGGIGENSPIIRGLVINRLAFLGLELDEAKNEETWRGATGVITTSTAPFSAVVPTNEELEICLQTRDVVNG